MEADKRWVIKEKGCDKDQNCENGNHEYSTELLRINQRVKMVTMRVEVIREGARG